MRKLIGILIMVLCMSFNDMVYTASYYGKEHHGKKTASGQKFNMYDMTAAHKSLPFGTKVKVTNIKNGKSVIVRINDRGPFSKNRELDLSYSAFKEISSISNGLVKITYEVVE